MALIRVKICGITTKAEVDAVNRCRPDYMGFVFADSRRRVTYEEAANLKRQLSSGIKAVGVFVNEPIDYILKLVQERVVDLIQLHGEEDESYLRLLRQKTACPIMRAVRVRNTKQILEASDFPVICCYWIHSIKILLAEVENALITASFRRFKNLSFWREGLMWETLDIVLRDASLMELMSAAVLKQTGERMKRKSGKSLRL